MVKLSIGILEDDEILSNNLSTYLNNDSGFEIVFELTKFSDLNNSKILTAPDFILLDIHLKDIDGLAIIGNLLEHFPNTSIIVITGDPLDNLVLKALKNGAKGYLQKPFSFAKLMDSINTINASGSYLDHNHITKVVNYINSDKKSQLSKLKQNYRLTDREFEVLNYLSNGFSYKEIAETLSLSFHTVNHHLKSIYIKLNVNSIGQLFAKYL